MDIASLKYGQVMTRETGGLERRVTAALALTPMAQQKGSTTWVVDPRKAGQIGALVTFNNGAKYLRIAAGDDPNVPTIDIDLLEQFDAETAARLLPVVKGLAETYVKVLKQQSPARGAWGGELVEYVDFAVMRISGQGENLILTAGEQSPAKADEANFLAAIGQKLTNLFQQATEVVATPPVMVTGHCRTHLIRLVKGDRWVVVLEPYNGKGTIEAMNLPTTVLAGPVIADFEKALWK